ncbi:MAG: PaaI family thioesterase [Wenzhouxiangellaceae bacterium]|nr:PaaI family thioesterase [Wenzhouxiangellaceae bacterium]
MAALPEGKSLQEHYAPHNACFGCGPANEKGLRIRSFPQEPEGDEVVCRWTPEPHHEAFPGVLNGGIIGAILDCHCNWTAAWHLMQQRGLDTPPCTVTMEFSVRLRRPTPSDTELKLVARPSAVDGDIVTVESELFVDDKLCDQCTGRFVAVRPGHPAYHRW